MSTSGLRIIESCLDCELRREGFFCYFARQSLEAFDIISYPFIYPRGVPLFLEGQESRGVYVLCAGRVKRFNSSIEGKTIITGISEPGEVLGISAAVLNMPYEVTAETVDSCHVVFVKRDNFMRFLSDSQEAGLRVAEHLSRHYQSAYEQFCRLTLHPAIENLARMLLHWCAESGIETEHGIRLKLTLSQEEIGQMIGITRETVGRMLADLKSKRLISLKGSTLLIHNMDAIKALAKS